MKNILIATSVNLIAAQLTDVGRPTDKRNMPSHVALENTTLFETRPAGRAENDGLQLVY